MGSLKILKSLKEKGMLSSRRMGRAVFYKCNTTSKYFLKLMELVYLDHSSRSPFVRGWIADLQQLEPLADMVLLYGSLLTKEKSAKDVDVCIVLAEPSGYEKAEERVKSLSSSQQAGCAPALLHS